MAPRQGQLLKRTTQRRRGHEEIEICLEGLKNDKRQKRINAFMIYRYINKSVKLESRNLTIKYATKTFGCCSENAATIPKKRHIVIWLLETQNYAIKTFGAWKESPHLILVTGSKSDHNERVNAHTPRKSSGNVPAMLSAGTWLDHMGFKIPSRNSRLTRCCPVTTPQLASLIFRHITHTSHLNNNKENGTPTRDIR